MTVRATRRSLLLGGAGLIALALAGCGSAPDPTPLQISISADKAVNPGEAGEASPIVVRVYELKGIKAFSNASFFDFDDEAKTLGPDLIASREYELVPGQSKDYKVTASSEAAYLGVVASFRDITTAKWRDSIELRKEKKNRFQIYVTSLAVRIEKIKGIFE
jgi:type VI secretion system protein VasD